MHQTLPNHPVACPLFAEWKLTDAAREFRETIGIQDTTPITRVTLSTSLAGTITSPEAKIQYLPLTITGYRRIRQGCHFFFGMGAVPGCPRTEGSHSPAHVRKNPVKIPVTTPAGYLSTLMKMHRHGLPLTGSESLIAGALAALPRRRTAQKNHRCRPLLLATDATRVVLPERGIYDLPLGRILTKKEAASETILGQSHAAYRNARGYECSAPSHTAEPETFLTADLHLGHREATGYYCRPFLPDDTNTMNHVLMDNWNHTISPDDSVIFAGDFTYKADREQTDAWRSALNGTITWIQGNHDTCLEDACPSHTFTADGRTFLVVHNPKHVPATYRGWVIHGHTHNARLGDYPFISFTNKTVNISTDVTGYRPVPLKEILALIRDGERTGRTAPILIREMPPAPN